MGSKWVFRTFSLVVLTLAISGSEGAVAANAASAASSPVAAARRHASDVSGTSGARQAERSQSAPVNVAASGGLASPARGIERAASSAPAASGPPAAVDMQPRNGTSAASDAAHKKSPENATKDERDEISFSLKDMSFHVSSNNKPLVWCVALALLAVLIFLVYKGFGPGKSKETASTSKAWIFAGPFFGVAVGLLFWFISNKEKPQNPVVSAGQSAAFESRVSEQLTRLSGEVTQHGTQLKTLEAGLPDRVASTVAAKLRLNAAIDRPTQTSPYLGKVASAPVGGNHQVIASAQTQVAGASAGSGATTSTVAPDPQGVRPQVSPLTKSSWTNYRCTYITARKDQEKELAALDTIASEAATFCSPREMSSTLIPGQGDVVVVLDADQFYAAMSNKPPAQPWLLSINGKTLGDSAVVDSQIARNNEVLLRFRVIAGTSPDSLAFWTSAYQRTGFHAYEPLLIELGWEDIPEYFRPPGKVPNTAAHGQRDNLRIASRGALILALGSGILVLLLFVWAMYRTDLFRVGPSSAYLAAFSFARVQWGAWMLFALIAALYLWVIYGNFPDLTGSVAILVGVSTLTATTSFFMDPKTSSPPVATSGLLRDLLSDNNDDLQAHRLQALTVNILLLVAGIIYVGRHLSYPEFPDTWLAMLGISNAGALAGKQILENKTQAGSAGKRVEAQVSKTATSDLGLPNLSGEYD